MRKLIIYLSQFLILVVFTEFVVAGESSYRLAGIITSADTQWRAIIEMPDGKQQQVYEGDTIREATVLQISEREVLLDLNGGILLLRLTSSENEQQPPARKGVPANEFLGLIKGTPDLIKSGELPGLADMNQLPKDVRIISINGTTMTSARAGLQIVQEAISRGSLIRLTLEEGAAMPIIYLRAVTFSEESEAL